MGAAFGLLGAGLVRLLEIACGLSTDFASAVGEPLLASIERFRRSAPAEDDETVVERYRQGRGMIISVRQFGAGRIVELGGEVDYSSSPSIRRELLDLLGQTSRLALNLQALRRIDSSGIATLIEVYKEAQRLRKEFILFGLSPSVRETLHLTHVNRIFRIVDTKEQALFPAVTGLAI